MQLPRGTFLIIKRSTKFGDLFSELHEMKFTGVCTIWYKTGNGTIVFKHGKRILAEFQNTTGDAAWDAFQKIISEKADASLSTLSEVKSSSRWNSTKPALLPQEQKQKNPPLWESRYHSRTGRCPLTSLPHTRQRRLLIKPSRNRVSLNLLHYLDLVRFNR